LLELEQQAAALRDRPPAGTEALAQGDDHFELHLSFVARKELPSYPYHEDQGYTASITPTWNAIFAAVAPPMINEASDQGLRKAFRDFLTRESLKAFQNRKEFKGKTLWDFSFRADEIETCMVQLRALELIRENDRKRSVKDTDTYWTLTPYGNTLMVQLRAVRREPLPDDTLVGEATESSTDAEQS
jgi:hypothetical protein